MLCTVQYYSEAINVKYLTIYFILMLDILVYIYKYRASHMDSIIHKNEKQSIYKSSIWINFL